MCVCVVVHQYGKSVEQLLKREFFTGLEANPALCTVLKVTMDPGVSPASGRLLQTEEHGAENQQALQRGHHKALLNYSIKEENL